MEKLTLIQKIQGNEIFSFNFALFCIKRHWHGVCALAGGSMGCFNAGGVEHNIIKTIEQRQIIIEEELLSIHLKDFCFIGLLRRGGRGSSEGFQNNQWVG